MTLFFKCGKICEISALFGQIERVESQTGQEGLMADLSGGGSKQISNFVAGCLLSSKCGENLFEGAFLAFSTIRFL